MPSSVYFIRRLSTGVNYSFSGFALSKNAEHVHRKVVKDWLVQKAFEVGIQPGEMLAIKDRTNDGKWATFSVGRNGTVRFVGWEQRRHRAVVSD